MSYIYCIKRKHIRIKYQYSRKSSGMKLGKSSERVAKDFKVSAPCHGSWKQRSSILCAAACHNAARPKTAEGKDEMRKQETVAEPSSISIYNREYLHI